MPVLYLRLSRDMWHETQQWQVCSMNSVHVWKLRIKFPWDKPLYSVMGNCLKSNQCNAMRMRERVMTVLVQESLRSYIWWKAFTYQNVKEPRFMGPTLSSLRRGLFKTKFSKQGFDGRSALLWGDRVAARRGRRLHRRLLRLLLHRPLLAEEGPEEGRPLVDLSNFFIKLKLGRLRLHLFSMKPTWMKRDVNWYFLKLKLRLRLHMLFLKLAGCQLMVHLQILSLTKNSVHF